MVDLWILRLRLRMTGGLIQDDMGVQDDRGTDSG